MAGLEGLLVGFSGSCGQGSLWLGKEQEHDNDTYVQTVTGDTVWTSSGRPRAGSSAGVP